MNSEKKYIPSRDDIESAEAMLTQEQREQSLERLQQIGTEYGATPAEHFTPLYVGAFLSTKERERLRAQFPPEHIKEFLHHMTFAFQPTPEEAYALPIGEEIDLLVVGIAQDERGQALVLESPYPTRGVPHITISTAGNVGAVYSNTLIATRGYIPLETPIPVRARIGYGDNTNNISFDVAQEITSPKESPQSRT